MYLFSYSFLTVKEIYMYPVGAAKRGLVNYMIDGVKQCNKYVLGNRPNEAKSFASFWFT